MALLSTLLPVIVMVLAAIVDDDMSGGRGNCHRGANPPNLLDALAGQNRMRHAEKLKRNSAIKHFPFSTRE